jgi:hypothetical protein
VLNAEEDEDGDDATRQQHHDDADADESQKDSPPQEGYAYLAELPQAQPHGRKRLWERTATGSNLRALLS